MGRIRHDRELFWRDLLRRQTESGLSVANFCRQESISAPSFYAWRRKLRERDGGAARDDRPLEVEANLGARLVPVQIESEARSTPVRIFLPQGMSVDVSANIDRSALVELLGALREAQRC